MALGKQLLNAREQKGLSASEVAAITQVKVQIIEAIEREDFSKIAAPIYGKGFIRLYAEAVDVDADPLLLEYTTRFASQKSPSLVASSEGKAQAGPVSAGRVSVPRRRPPGSDGGGKRPVKEGVTDEGPDLFTVASEEGGSRYSQKHDSSGGRQPRGGEAVLAGITTFLKTQMDEVSAVCKETWRSIACTVDKYMLALLSLYRLRPTVTLCAASGILVLLVAVVWVWCWIAPMPGADRPTQALDSLLETIDGPDPYFD